MTVFDSKWPVGLERTVCVCVCVCRGRDHFLVSLWQSFSQSVVFRRPEGLNEENSSYISLVVLGLFGLILTDRR